MSSFKKAIPKRKYRERSQPEHRKHLGLLEKKRDYKLRAEDSHKKEKELSKLKEKAFFRNPDEFYFSMEKTRIIGGKHRKEAEEISGSLKKKKKLHEGNLLTMKVQNKLSKHSQLQSQLHLIDAPSMNTHMIFVSDSQKINDFNLANHFKTAPEIVNQKSNRLSKEQLGSAVLAENYEPEGYQEFESLLKDEKLLKKSLEKTWLEKNKMNDENFKVIDEEKGICKWFRERKR